MSSVMVKAAAFLRGILFLAAFCAWAEPTPLSMRYALAREVELGKGTLGEAIRLYREILPDVSVADPALAAQVLFRIGVCEREMGRLPEARQAWRQLIETCPADHPLVARAREEVKELEREVGRVVMRGRVVDDKGQPLPGAFVMVGDWGNAPPLIAGTNGTFQADRQVMGRLANGDRYGLVYIEHPEQPSGLAAVWRESSARAQDFRLSPLIALAGYVVDPRGRPVAGATLRITGWVDDATEAAMPVWRFFPTLQTDTNGLYRFDGLAAGLRYLITVEKDGYRMGKSTGDGAVGKATGGPASEVRTVYAPEITLVPVGRIAVDETGILRAEVNLNDPAERARLEETLANFEPGRKEGGGREVVVPAGRLPTCFPYDEFPFSLRWLRGDPTAGSPLNADDLKGHAVVYRFSSAYLDASLKRQFPDEPGVLSQMARLFGRRGVLCVWIVPSADGAEEAVRLALETCVDVPTAVDQDGKMGKALGVMGYGGNVVVDQDGGVRAVCTDQQLFKVIKEITTP
jgi:hypothetical protein